MMNNRNLPTDMNTNRYEKPVQTPSRGAEGASPDCVTIEQCEKTTAAEVGWNLADKAEPSRYQETAVATEGAGTDGTTNVQGRSIDCNKRRTTVRKLATDYLEIPEPGLPRVFLDLAEEARNVKVENGRSCYTKEVQPQGTGLTRPVFVTVMVDSPHVLKKRALRATGVSTEMIPNTSSAGRCEPGDPVGPSGPTEYDRAAGLARFGCGSVGNRSSGPSGPRHHDGTNSASG